MNKVEDFVAPDAFKRMMKFAEQQQETPFVMIDLDTISRAYDELVNAFPDASVYFAVKANPAIEITQLLNNKGSCFDIASVYELDKVMSVGVPPERISFGNTIKKPAHIEYFFNKGVRLFASDSIQDLNNIAKYAPNSRVYCRILVDEIATADWPLSKKFGCSTEMASHLLVEAKKLNLVPYGVSFHVGSQQRSKQAWKIAIDKAIELFHQLEKDHGIVLDLLNLGGGLPANYVVATETLKEYATSINGYLNEAFDKVLHRKPAKIIIEPGRSLVGNSGILVSEVVLASRKGVFDDDSTGNTNNNNNNYNNNNNNNTTIVASESAAPAADYATDNSANGTKWVFIDVGVFGGLMECLDEAVKYPILAQHTKQPNSKLAMCTPLSVLQKAKQAAAEPVPIINCCSSEENDVKIAINCNHDGLKQAASFYSSSSCTSESTIATRANSSTAVIQSPTSAVTTMSSSGGAALMHNAPTSCGSDIEDDIERRNEIATAVPYHPSFDSSTAAAVNMLAAADNDVDEEREGAIIAGPTCDSTDVLYKKNKYNLPRNINQGDRLLFLSTGAYTTSYSCVEFNGFPPLKTYCL